MAGLLAFIGRTTIAAVLFIAAYIHLTQPNWHHEFYVQSYEYIYGIIGTSAKIGGYSIPIPAQVINIRGRLPNIGPLLSKLLEFFRELLES